MKADLMDNVFLGAGSRLARYIPAISPRQMIKDAVADLREGGMLLLFPEGTRTTRDPINPLKASIGIIAKHANVPVQVAIIETDSPYLRKGWPLFRRPTLPITYRVRLGRRFDPPENVQQLHDRARTRVRAPVGRRTAIGLAHQRGQQYTTGRLRPVIVIGKMTAT